MQLDGIQIGIKVQQGCNLWNHKQTKFDDPELKKVMTVGWKVKSKKSFCSSWREIENVMIAIPIKITSTMATKTDTLKPKKRG